MPATAETQEIADKVRLDPGQASKIRRPQGPAWAGPCPATGFRRGFKLDWDLGLWA